MSSTILDLKKSFLQNQIRILSSPFSPPSRWRDTAPLTREHDPLPEKAVRDAMHKANVLLRQHIRSVYSTQTVRAVAEQIDNLYWNGGEPQEGEVQESAEEMLIAQNLDLTYYGDIAKLSREWPEEDTMDREPGNDDKVERERYTELRSRLSTLSEKEQDQRRKIIMYKRLLEMLRPFQEPKVNIQPNLVTKDGELGKELEKMKVFTVRLAEKVKSSEANGR